MIEKRSVHDAIEESAFVVTGDARQIGFCWHWLTAAAGVRLWKRIRRTRRHPVAVAGVVVPVIRARLPTCTSSWQRR